MKNLDKQTARSIIKYIFRREAYLNQAEKLRLLSSALEKAVTVTDFIEVGCALASRSCGDDKHRAREAFSTAENLIDDEDATTLLTLARNVIAPDLLDDKVWGRQLLERGVENTTEFNELVEAAMEASSPEGLADRSWAKTLLKQAVSNEIDFDSLIEAASVAGRSDAINDKRWSRELFHQAIATNDEVTSHELIQAALQITDDDVLGDKSWGRNLIEKACEDLQYGNDYLMVALCYAHSKKLNDKVRGFEWFQRAVGQYSIDTPADFFEIAQMVASKDILSFDLWAAALCETTANNSRDATELVDIACFVSTIDAREGLAAEIFKRAQECSKSPYELTMVAINVAIKFPALKRDWARRIFVHALQNADEIQKEMIEESMEEYL